MKTTDFAYCLTEFFKVYLPGKRGLSENTVKSYRDTFRYLLIFAEEQADIPAERMTIADFTEDFVFNFTRWLEESRHNSKSTRKQRLAAIHVFTHFLKTRKPDYLLEYQKILDIKVKKARQQSVSYLTPDEVKAVLAAPDLRDQFGRRDMVLLSVLYDSAARVQELCDMTVGSIRLQRPATVTIYKGKGEKPRVVPLMPETASVLGKYIADNRLDSPEKLNHPLFSNHQKSKLTRAGVTYILKKYCDAARKTLPTLPCASPHVLRHSKAMHLLKAGASLIYIRDFLGHESVSTTEIYAKADTEMKRAAIEKASPRLSPDLPDWTQDASLMAMLTDICR